MITWENLEAIRTQCRSVRAAAPAFRTNAQLVSEEQSWSTSVTGTSPEHFEIRNWPVASGALFGQGNVDAGTTVVVLGKTTAEKLFGPDTKPVGQLVRIKNTPFEVVGVAKTKGQSPQGQDDDDAAFVPATTFQAKIEGGLQKYVNGTLFVGADPSIGATAAQAEITAPLRETAPDPSRDGRRLLDPGTSPRWRERSRRAPRR